MKKSRRQFLSTVAIGSLTGLAGCSELPWKNSERKQELKNRIDELEARISVLESQKKTDKDKIQQLNQEIYSLRNQSKTQNQTINQQQHRIDELEQEIHRLENGAPANGVSEEALTQARDIGVEIRPSVVYIDLPSDGVGTGWCIGNGEIITNAHVAITDDLSCMASDGTRFNALRKNTHSDFVPDVAVLETNYSLPALSLGNSTDLSTDDVLVQVGNPLSVGYWIISAGHYTGRDTENNWLEIDIPAAKGNSGSPLVNLNGDVVGMTVGIKRQVKQPTGANNDSTVVYEQYPNDNVVAESIETIQSSIAEWEDTD